MLFEVYFTIAALALLALGAGWLLIRRPVKRRWELETRIEVEQKREQAREKALREAAQQEVEGWTQDAPEPDKATQENRTS